MKKYATIIMISVVLICLFLPIYVYAQKYEYEEYSGNVPYIEEQLTPEWCFYAVCSMLLEEVQCEIAEKYREWSCAEEGEFFDPDYHCCMDPYLWGGVKYRHVVDFWNVLSMDYKTSIVPFEKVFLASDRFFYVEMPRLGLLRVDDAGNACCHAIVVYYTTVSDSIDANTYTIISTTYYVEYVDPWDGQQKFRSVYDVHEWEKPAVNIEVLY